MSDSCCHDNSDHHNGNGHPSSDCCDDEAFLIEAFEFMASSETLIPQGSFTKIINNSEERTLITIALNSIVDQDFGSSPDHFSQRIFCVYRIWIAVIAIRSNSNYQNILRHEKIY